MGDKKFGFFKNIIGVDDSDEPEYEEVETVPEYKEYKAPQRTMSVERDTTSFTMPRNSDYRPQESANRVLNMSPATGKKQFKMVIIEPKSFDECPRLVDNLKNNKPVIINLERVESETAKKIFDFLSGATYAIDGRVQKIANNIFVFAPHSVDVMAPVPQKPQQQPQSRPQPADNDNMWRR